MFLTIFGKEFIIINEELAIYFSFLIVLSILISNFGSQLSKQFGEISNNIAQAYSFGSKEKHKFFLKYLIAKYKNLDFIKSLISFEVTMIFYLLKLKAQLVIAMQDFSSNR